MLLCSASTATLLGRRKCGREGGAGSGWAGLEVGWPGEAASKAIRLHPNPQPQPAWACAVPVQGRIVPLVVSWVL